MGVRRLLEMVLGERPNYILWNRNPDLFMDRWQNARFRTGLLTNSAMSPSLDLVDLVVLAGTPEWTGIPVERIYCELLRYPDVPLVALGVGGAGRGFRLSPLEREIYLRENTLLVCRNPLLAREINEQLDSTKAQVLPCPAFLSAPWDDPRTIDSLLNGRPTLNLQSDVVENQSVPTEHVDHLLNYLTDPESRADSRFVAHYIDEFFRFRRLFSDADIFFSYEPLDYLDFYREKPRALITSRLHGAIASLSCGTPACLIEIGSDRVNDAARPFGELLPCLPFDEALRWARESSTEQFARSSDTIACFKRFARDQHVTILEEFLGRHLPAALMEESRHAAS